MTYGQVICNSNLEVEGAMKYQQRMQSQEMNGF